MSFKLKPQDSLRKNLRRIVQKQIDGALDELTGSRGKSRDKTVHEARKAIKKVRAILRLIRPGIGGSAYRYANEALRDAARPLTDVRDAKILIEVTDKLADHFQDKVAGRSFAEVRKALMSHARAVRKRVLNQERAFSRTRKELRAFRPEVKHLFDIPNKWSSIGKGLGETYRRASDAFSASVADPQVEKLHEWRKQAKYLRYQLELLQPIWPERMQELADEADRMSELLGDDRDLALLRQMLTSDQERFGESGDVELLLALIEHRQTQLRQDALLLAERFFVEPVADFTRSLKGYWRTFRAANKAKHARQLESAVA